MSQTRKQAAPQLCFWIQQPPLQKWQFPLKKMSTSTSDMSTSTLEMSTLFNLFTKTKPSYIKLCMANCNWNKHLKLWLKLSQRFQVSTGIQLQNPCQHSYHLDTQWLLFDSKGKFCCLFLRNHLCSFITYHWTGWPPDALHVESLYIIRDNRDNAISGGDVTHEGHLFLSECHWGSGWVLSADQHHPR